MKTELVLRSLIVASMLGAVLVNFADMFGSEEEERPSGPDIASLFVETNVALQDLGNSFGAMGDVDGDLDVVIVGGKTGSDHGVTANVNFNDGFGAFTSASAPLTGVKKGSVALGDATGDGHLDLVIVARSTTRQKEGET